MRWEGEVVGYEGEAGRGGCAEEEDVLGFHEGKWENCVDVVASGLGGAEGLVL